MQHRAPFTQHSAADCEDRLHHPLLACGISISNLRDLMHGGGTGSGLGSLGFFALENGSWRESKPVLVSNHHVLFAHGAEPGALVHQPEFSSENGINRFEQSKLHPIAQLSQAGMEGHHPYAYPGEDTQKYFVDCAAARLLPEFGDRFSNAMRSGTTVLRKIARAHPFDANGRYRVWKCGRSTGITEGILMDAEAPVRDKAGNIRRGNMVIRATRPNCRGEMRFCDEGDSGAPLFNASGELIGLLWGRSLVNPALGYGCHVHPVLDVLKVSLALPRTLAPGHSSTFKQQSP